jgi:hypothetical protein
MADLGEADSRDNPLWQGADSAIRAPCLSVTFWRGHPPWLCRE